MDLEVELISYSAYLSILPMTMDDVQVGTTQNQTANYVNFSQPLGLTNRITVVESNQNLALKFLWLGVRPPFWSLGVITVGISR